MSPSKRSTVDRFDGGGVRPRNVGATRVAGDASVDCHMPVPDGNLGSIKGIPLSGLPQFNACPSQGREEGVPLLFLETDLKASVGSLSHALSPWANDGQSDRSAARHYRRWYQVPSVETLGVNAFACGPEWVSSANARRLTRKNKSVKCRCYIIYNKSKYR